jgi:hypothetical protein
MRCESCVRDYAVCVSDDSDKASAEAEMAKPVAVRRLDARLQAVSDYARRASGSVNQKLLPVGTPASTPIVPPCASTASLQNARPKPTEW